MSTYPPFSAVIMQPFLAQIFFLTTPTIGYGLLLILFSPQCVASLKGLYYFSRQYRISKGETRGLSCSWSTVLEYSLFNHLQQIIVEHLLWKFYRGQKCKLQTTGMFVHLSWMSQASSYAQNHFRVSWSTCMPFRLHGRACFSHCGIV